MSFVIGVTSRRAAAVAIPAARAISTTTVVQKTATETVKDTLKAVDKTVASKIVDGIEVSGECFFLFQGHAVQKHGAVGLGLFEGVG
jgi:hypothetical protein